MVARSIAKRTAPPMGLADKAAEAARLLEALANPRRLATLCRLVEGERTVGELATAEGLSLSAMSQHLARLREDGLVATRRTGQTIHYRLADARVRKIIAVLHREFCA